MTFSQAALFFLVVGVALVVAMTYLSTRPSLLGVMKPAKALGKIVRVEKVQHDEKTSPTWAPVVRFTAADGREFEFTSPLAIAGLDKQVGAQVQVVYDSRYPKNARLAGGLALYKGPVLLLASLLGVSALFGVFQIAKTSEWWPSKARSSVTGAFAGRWTNVDPYMSYIARIEIAPARSGISVQMWNKCRRQDCDWGEPASYDNRSAEQGTMSVVWESGIFEYKQELTILPDGRLRVVTDKRFIYGLGRHDKSTEYFALTSRPSRLYLGR